MLKRIKYISRFAPGLSIEDVDDIINVSRENNPRREVTGVLMTAGGLFYQVLEGPPEHVDALYEVIRKDPRHGDVFMLDSVTGCEERLYPDWSLAKLDLDTEADMRLEPTKALLSAVTEQRALLQNLVSSLERALWFELVSTRGPSVAPFARTA